MRPPSPRIKPDDWLSPTGWRAITVAGAFFLIVVGVTALVWMAGGTRYAYVHTAYVPIVLAGFAFGPIGGVISALAIGLAVGPWMPIEVATGEAQPVVSWATRIGFFVLIGVLVGVAARTLRAQANRLHARALRDPATELSNGRAIDLAIDRQPPDRPAALICVDLDCIPNLERALGSQAVDAVVAEAAKRVSGVLTVEHLVGRIGADQLAILLYDHDRATAEIVARTLILRLRTPITFAGVPFRLEPHAGLAALPQDTLAAPALRRAGLFAMEQATELGQAIQVYDPTLDVPDLNTDAITQLSDLRNAIARDELNLHFQPKVDLASGRVVGVEALARWSHPERGAVSPAIFVGHAERTGLIHPLTSWVMRASVGAAGSFAAAGSALPVSFNVSAKNLVDRTFPRRLISAARRAGVTPGHLEVEVTETALIKWPDLTLAALQKIRDAGFPIWIDDFGTGYASLDLLRLAPVTGIKIDRSFVADMGCRPRDRDLVAGTIDIAHRLGLGVVAEGVETQEAADFLRKCGCDQAQGWFYGRPVPADDIVAGLSPPGAPPQSIQRTSR